MNAKTSCFSKTWFVDVVCNFRFFFFVVRYLTIFIIFNSSIAFNQIIVSFFDIQLFNYLIIQSFNHSIIQLFNYSIFRHLIIQSFNFSIFNRLTFSFVINFLFSMYSHFVFRRFVHLHAISSICFSIFLQSINSITILLSIQIFSKFCIYLRTIFCSLYV